MFTESEFAVGIMSFLAANIIVLSIMGLLSFLSIFFIFHKAGKHWWAAFIPIYNAIVFLQIAGKGWYWILLLLIPVVNIFLLISVYIGFVKNFGRSGWGVLLLLFFPFLYLPYLAFAPKVKYVANESQAAAA